MPGSDIFVSYEKHDRDVARALAEDLIAEGYAVWWDRNLIAGEDYVQTIDLELRSAHCVLVLWSQDSVHSRWVVGEAETAANLNKLIPVLIDDADPQQISSAGLRVLQCVKSEDRNGLLRAINAKFSAAPTATGFGRRRSRPLARILRRVRRNITPARALLVAVSLAVVGLLLFDYTAWQDIDGSLTAKDYQDYRAAFPWPRLYSKQALARLSGVKEFDGINSASGFTSFTMTYPESMYAPLARIRAGRLRQFETGVYKPAVTGSDLHPLDAATLGQLQCKDLWVARNEIFFHDGYCFTTERGENYFKTMDDCPVECAARRTINRFVSNKTMNEIEVRNIESLKEREKELGCSQTKATDIPDC